MQTVEFMTMDRIFQNIYSALAQSDSTVQLWTSFTFAAIVAAHLGASRIRPGTYRLIVFLYGLYSLVAIVKYLASAYQIVGYQALLVSRDLEQWAVPSAFGMFIGGGTLILIVGGSLGTLLFLRTCIKSAEAGGS